MMSATKLPQGIEKRPTGYRYRWVEPTSKLRQYGPTGPLDEAVHLRLWVMAQGREVLGSSTKIAKGAYLREEVGQGTDNTFLTCSQGWMQEQSGTEAKESSLREYQWTINRCESIFSLGVSELTAPRMNKLKAVLQKKYKPLTVRNTIRMVRAIVKYALDNRVITKDPAPRFKYGKGLERTRKHRYLTPTEYLALRAAARDDTVRLMFDCMMYTGMRVGEMLGMRVEQLFLDESQPYILIDHARRPNGGYGGTKSGKSRPALIDQNLAEALRKHCENTRPTLFVFPSRYRPQHSWSHGGFTKTAWNQAVDRAIENSGLSLRSGRPTPHDLRHSFAAWMLEKWPLNVVSELLGHSSPIITAEVYSHRVAQKEDRTVLTIGDALAAASLVVPPLALAG